MGTSFRDAAWILLGTLLGLAACVLVSGHLATVTTVTAAPLASLAVFALLLGSLNGPDRASRMPI